MNNEKLVEKIKKSFFYYEKNVREISEDPGLLYTEGRGKRFFLPNLMRYYLSHYLKILGKNDPGYDTFVREYDVLDKKIAKLEEKLDNRYQVEVYKSLTTDIDHFFMRIFPLEDYPYILHEVLNNKNYRGSIEASLIELEIDGYDIHDLVIRMSALDDALKCQFLRYIDILIEECPELLKPENPDRFWWHHLDKIQAKKMAILPQPVEKEFESNYLKHVFYGKEWDRILTPDEYKKKATRLLERRDTGVEVYHLKGNDNILVYDRVNNEAATGAKDGHPHMYFIPDNQIEHFIDKTLCDLLVKVPIDNNEIHKGREDQDDVEIMLDDYETVVRETDGHFNELKRNGRYQVASPYGHKYRISYLLNYIGEDSPRYIEYMQKFEAINQELSELENKYGKEYRDLLLKTLKEYSKRYHTIISFFIRDPVEGELCSDIELYADMAKRDIMEILLMELEGDYHTHDINLRITELDKSLKWLFKYNHLENFSLLVMTYFPARFWWRHPLKIVS